MKNIFKVLLLTLALFVFNCEQSDSRFGGDDPSTGWIEFQEQGATITIVTTSLRVPVEINVPTFEQGMDINFRFEAVTGDFNEILTNASIRSVNESPFESDRIALIDLEFEGVDMIDDIIVFDIILESTSSPGVKIGVDENSITSYRISTPCPIDINGFAGTYTVDEVFTSGINEGLTLSGAFGESYSIEMAVNADDVTQTQLIITNTPGSDIYIADQTILSFDTCNGTVSFSQDPLNLAAFADFNITSNSYTEDPFVITCDGTLGNFGPYQFILTKQ